MNRKAFYDSLRRHLPVLSQELVDLSEKIMDLVEKDPSREDELLAQLENGPFIKEALAAARQPTGEPTMPTPRKSSSFGGFVLFLVVGLGCVWAFFRFIVGIDLVAKIGGLF